MSKSSQPIAKLIAQALEQRIIEGVHHEPVPLRQADLALEFGTSHIPVREALASLAEKGLVEIIPNRGAVIVPLSSTHCLELAEMRAALEPIALRESVPRLDPAGLKAAHDALRRGRSASKLSARARLNWEFHRALYAAADRRFLLSQLDGLWRHAERYLVYAWKHANYEARSDDEHEAIYEACASRDIASACRLTRNHIIAAARSVVSLLAKEPRNAAGEAD
jgi:DNA-binding GntR family transcriptional regulator